MAEKPPIKKIFMLGQMRALGIRSVCVTGDASGHVDRKNVDAGMSAAFTAERRGGRSASPVRTAAEAVFG
jgi:hypothetical protein